MPDNQRYSQDNLIQKSENVDVKEMYVLRGEVTQWETLISYFF